MRLDHRIYVCSLISLVFAVSAAAHEREPINTEYAPPVEDLIFDWTLSRFDRGNGTLFALPAFGFEGPLVRGTQIELGIPLLHLDSDGGESTTSFGDLEVGLRYQLLTETRSGARPDLDLNFEVGLPTA